MTIYTNNPAQTCPVMTPLRHWFREKRAHELATALDVRAAGTAGDFAARLDALSAFATGMATFARDVADGQYEVEAIDRNGTASGDVCGRMAGLARLADANARDSIALVQRAATAAYDGDVGGALTGASHAVERALWAAGFALDAYASAPLTPTERNAAHVALWEVGCLLCVDVTA